MNLKTFAAASCLSMAMATSAIAAPITLDFAFGGTTGTFYGLDDDDGIVSASSYDLSFSSLGGGSFDFTNVSTTQAISNAFQFSGGALLDVDYSEGGAITSDDGAAGLIKLIVGLNVADVSLLDTSTPAFVGVSSNPVFTINPVAAVPLPAGGLLLLSAVGGVAALKRRKKRAA